mmetsp:Transcript_103032/g.245419  ORF Transcript_103032/g.245419 Transcript_103032/m.245419 type:complete len:245 (-) Transcript_103032:59-793(-)
MRLNALSRLSRSFPGIVPTFQHIGICKLSSQGFPCQGAFVSLPTGENNLLAGHHWWQLVHPVIQGKNPGTPRNSSVCLALYLFTRANVHEDSTLPDHLHHFRHRHQARRQRLSQLVLHLGHSCLEGIAAWSQLLHTGCRVDLHGVIAYVDWSHGSLLLCQVLLDLLLLRFVQVASQLRVVLDALCHCRCRSRKSRRSRGYDGRRPVPPTFRLAESQAATAEQGKQQEAKGTASSHVGHACRHGS